MSNCTNIHFRQWALSVAQQLSIQKDEKIDLETLLDDAAKIMQFLEGRKDANISMIITNGRKIKKDNQC